MIKLYIEGGDMLAGAGAVLESAVFNEARSKQGFAYFWAVDLGRGPVFPVRAKALKIQVGPDKFIFRKSAKAAAPRNITGKAMQRFITDAIAAARQVHARKLRAWFAGFLNFTALRQADSFARATPRGFSGKLGSSYRVRRTI